MKLFKKINEYLNIISEYICNILKAIEPFEIKALIIVLSVIGLTKAIGLW